MTLDEILSGSAANASEQLKKIFMLKSFKSRISNVSSDSRWFRERVQRNVIGIVEGKLSTFGIYGDCCAKCSDCFPLSSPATSTEKMLPEELKPELLKTLKENAFKALDRYKEELDDFFGVEKEEPKQSSTETADTGAEASTETETSGEEGIE